jgi:hypothetical protein
MRGAIAISQHACDPCASKFIATHFQAGGRSIRRSRNHDEFHACAMSISATTRTVRLNGSAPWGRGHASGCWLGVGAISARDTWRRRRELTKPVRDTRHHFSSVVPVIVSTQASAGDMVNIVDDEVLKRMGGIDTGLGVDIDE